MLDRVYVPPAPVVVDPAAAAPFTETDTVFPLPIVVTPSSVYTVPEMETLAAWTISGGSTPATRQTKTASPIDRRRIPEHRRSSRARWKTVYCVGIEAVTG